MTVLHHVSAGTAVPGRPPVVLLGSLGSTLEMWRPQLDALSAGTLVIALDHRGHGGSPLVPGPATVPELAADVLETLDGLGVADIDLAGLSLGGAVAQYLAATDGRVRRLALLCTAPRFGEPAGWVERAAAARRDGTASLADAVVGRWFSPGWAAANPDLVNHYRAMVAGIPGEGYAACCDALSGWDFRDRLGEITVPVLTVAGAQDPSTPPDVVSEITGGVTDGHSEILDPAAHVPTIERPDEVTSLLARHFSGGAE